jgi:6-phosphogluconolactonase (cycloisomerase 2 family)
VATPTAGRTAGSLDAEIEGETMPPRTPTRLVSALALSGAAGLAAAQADFPAIFVANDGNLEGSVTSLRVEPDGSLSFVDRVITGTRPSTSQPCAGCNPVAIDLTPGGRFLATAHASGDAGENLTVYEVAPDGSLAVVDELLLAQGGLDILWITDDLIALPLTDLSSPNRVRLFRLDNDNELSEITSAVSGTFLTSIALHPNRRWLYANDSFNNTVRLFEIDAQAGTLSLEQTIGIPVFGVSLAIDPAGAHLYAAGGISAGGNAFAGLAIDPADGTLTQLPGSPFQSPGASPKGFAFTPDGAVLFVSHGTDATIQSFTLAPDGTPTFSGNAFDVGLQGTLQGMDTLDGLLFAIDETTAIDGVDGAYSFATAPDGSFSPVTPVPLDTQGVSPGDVVAWAGADPSCNPSDLAEPFGVLDLADIQAFIAGFLIQDPIADLAPPAGVFDLADLQAFIVAFTAGCP